MTTSAQRARPRALRQAQGERVLRGWGGRAAPAAALSALVLALGAAPAPARGPACSNPGRDGAATIGGIVNSYYPGVAAPAGSTSILVGGIDTSGGGAATSIAAGDLVLVIQMQDADIDFTNGDAYGGSAPGSGYTALNAAGRYEYAVVASVAGSTLGLTAPLVNGYRNAGYAAGQAGQRRFQVIRVPQYSAATFTGTVYLAPPWNGATGGVAAVDVAGRLSWNGATIEVSGRGFRGGGGRSLAGAAGLSNLDYATPATSAAHASKGEGVAGTPRYVFTPSNAAPANYLTNGAGALTDTGVEGYPGGSHARGAPGNAGGGGSDGNPAANDQNTGGGGGGAYAAGGMGGYGWTPGTLPGSRSSGFGGASIPMAPGLLTLGGGGGAGSTNNGTGTPAGGLASSGAAGGGIVILRAGTIIGTGRINANGANANNSVLNDSSGGGGGAGAVLVFASGNGGSVGTLTVQARGGNGGSNAPGGGVNPHGPGGGGSGGFAAVTSASGVTIDVSAGVAGTTNTSATSTGEYGATSSSGGWRLHGFEAEEMPGAMANPLCLPLLTVTKTAVRQDVMRGGAGGYVLTIRNEAGRGAASGVVLSDTLPGAPAAFTFAATEATTLTGGATRTATADPAAGATSPSWGSFTLPGGGAIAVRFQVAIPAGTTPATYQNSATVAYVDPTRTAGTTTVSPGGTYGSGGTVPGSNYAGAASTQEDVNVWLPATVTKSFAPATVGVGQPSVLSIVVANPNTVSLTGAAFTDSYPANLVNLASPGASISGAGCSGAVAAAPGGGSVSLAGGVIPAGGSCTLQVQVTTTAAGSLGNIIPAGALTSDRNVSNPAAAAAALNQAPVQPPSATIAFLPSTIQQGATTTLQITILDGGATSLTGVAFSDALTGMQVAASPGVTSTCNGTVTAAAGSGSVTLAGGTLAAGATCTVTVQVTSSIVSPPAGHPNQLPSVASTQSGAGPSSNTARLVVAGTPTIAQTFSPALVAPGAASTLTFTVSNPGNVPLNAASFSDAMGDLTVAATGPAGGTCAGAAGNTLAAGTSNLFLGGLTIPAAGSCTVTVPVTGTTGGLHVNVASGVTSNETPVAGPQPAAATLEILHAPRVTKNFAGEVEAASAASYSTLTITVINPNAGTPLSGVRFTDSLVNMVVHTTPAASNTCGGTLTAAPGGAVVSLSGATLAAGASCTVGVRIRSSTPSPSGGHPNTVTAIAAETGAGAPATAYLNVFSPPTLAATFTPAAVAVAGVSTLVFTVTNPNAIPLTSVTFTNTFPTDLTTTNVAQSYVGAGRGTCAGLIPSTQAAGTYFTSLTFSGVNLPASSSCTIYVDVRSALAGNYSNTSSGATSFETPTAGPASNVATLAVGRISVAKAFAPSTIVVGGTSTLTFTLVNRSGGNRANITFTDAFPAGMQVATPLATTNGCGGTLQKQTTTAALAAGDTGLRYAGGTLANGATCTITVAVTATAAGSYSNTATGLTWTGGGGGTGPNSTPATLVALAHPTIAIDFSPASLDLYATSTMTFTLSNANASSLSSARFTDTLAGFAVAAPASLGGSCAGVTSAPALATGATALDLTVPNLLPGTCTISLLVTRASATPGTFANTASGLTTTQTGAAGPQSNTASITFNKLPLQVVKSTNLVLVTPGTAVTYTIGYANPNATAAFGNVVLTDVTPKFTAFSAASCGALPPGITSCSISAPPVGGTGTVTWTLGGALQAGASGTVTLTVVVR